MLVAVVVAENKTEAPQLKSDCDGGKVASTHVVLLSCATPDALIYYTTDGMAPHLHSAKIKVPCCDILYSRKRYVGQCYLSGRSRGFL